MSLISLYLLDKGYSAFDVSIVSSSSLIASLLLIPVIGRIIDNHGIKRVGCALLCVAALSSILFLHTQSLFETAFFYSVTIIIITALHLAFERTVTLTPYNYGSIRIWGTIGNAIGLQCGGLLYRYVSPHTVYVAFSVGAFLTALAMSQVNETSTTGMEHYQKSGSINGHAPKKVLATYFIIICLFYAALDTRTLYLPAFFASMGVYVDRVTMLLFVASLFEIPM